MAKDIRIYVAGPFSSPDPCVNTRNAILAGDALAAAGFFPYVPHLTLLWHTISPHDYEFWMRLDLCWLRQCNAVLRLPGYSLGADRETAEAGRIGIPVFASMDELCVWAHNGVGV